MTNSMYSLGSIVCLALGGPGCRGLTIEPTTPVKQSARTASATLVVGEITHPRDLGVSGFYVAMQREIGPQLEHASLTQKIVSERDLGPAGVTGLAYALRYRVIGDVVVVESTGGGCVVGLTVSGCFTILPLFFLGLCTRTTEHRLTLEARVFDLGGARVSKVQDTNSNEMLNVYDTSSLTPLLRKEYPIKVDVKSAAFGGGAGLTGDAQLEAVRLEAAESVRQILAQSLDDVARVIH